MDRIQVRSFGLRPIATHLEMGCTKDECRFETMTGLLATCNTYNLVQAKRTSAAATLEDHIKLHTVIAKERLTRISNGYQ